MIAPADWILAIRRMTVTELADTLATIHQTYPTELPMINAIQFESTGKNLIAVGTDRFTLGASVADYEEAAGQFSFMLKLPQAQMVSKVAKSCKEAFSYVAVILVDNKVTFEFTSGESLTMPSLDENFPDWRKIVESKLGDADGSTKTIGVNPTYMARFGRVHNARRMIMKTTGSNSPIIVKVGSSFVGLSMPFRLDAVEAEWNSVDWLARPEPPKKPAAKRTRAPRKTTAKGAA